MRRKLIAFMAMVALCGATFGQGSKEAALDGTAASNGLGKKLVVYSTQTDPDIEVVVGGFEKTYGIDVEVINGSAGELRSRIASEAGNPQADVMWGGLSQSDGNAYADLFEPYVSPLNEELYEEYRSDNGFYNYPNVQLVNLIVNTDLAAKLGVEINGYEDLLPYMCASDHVLAELMHAKLIRTHTCATGGDSCDYWYVADGSDTAKAYADVKMV